MTWHVRETFDAPAKAETETPRGYLNRLDRWSHKRVAEVRKERAQDGHKYKLRRRWYGFTLVIEMSLSLEEPSGAAPSVGYVAPRSIGRA